MNATQKIFCIACVSLVINFLLTRLPCVYNSICGTSDRTPFWYCCISPFLFIAMVGGFGYCMGNLDELFKKNSL